MNGFLVLDKPEWVSSARAIAPIKRAVGAAVKVGHAGTLDPFATGGLLVLLGDATRLTKLCLTLPKTYEATVLFGTETETLDPEGTVVAQVDPGMEAPPDLYRAIASFVGEIEQTPPAHSAVKVEGKRAYDLARKGRDVRIEPRTVTVHEARLLEDRWPTVRIRFTCGSGTYLRSIARDLGRRLRLPAYLTALRRTHVGPFEARTGTPHDAHPALDAIRSRLRPALDIARAAGLPEVAVAQEMVPLFAQGRPLPFDDLGDETYAVIEAGSGKLIGLGTPTAEATLHPTLVLSSVVAEYLP